MVHRPSDSRPTGDGWTQELASLPSQPVLELLPRHSSEAFQGVRYSPHESAALPHLRLFQRAAGGRPFPALLEICRDMAASTTCLTGTTDVATVVLTLVTPRSALRR